MDKTEGYKEALKRIAECKKSGATFLSLFNLNLEKLPPQISELKWLKELNCSHNPIRDLTPLVGMSRMEALYCFKNQISDLAPLVGMGEMRVLHCDNNQIRYLVPLAGMNKMERLYCSDNQISDLAPLAGMSEMKKLSCGNNQISNLAPLAGMSKVQRPRYDNNPLKNPPQEIINQGWEAIKEYFSQENREKISLNEIKVMFIGTGGAGKTTIRQRLCGDQLNPDEQGTQGIEVRRWNTKYQNKKLRLNLWDFAGQEINYSLHELFFTSRTIYVVVLNGREEDTPEKWLEKVELLGGKESKIIVVRNKMDDDGFCDNPNFNFSGLKEKYSGISSELLCISARTGGGFEKFKKTLLKIVAEHPQTSDMYPLRYLSIKNKVEEYTAEGKNHLNYTVYENICREEGIQEADSIKRLLDILSDLGTVTYFDDPELKNIQILNPAWLSSGIYKLLRKAEKEKSGGVVKLSDFPLILQPGNEEKKQGLSWSEQEYPYLLKMLARYQQGLEIDHNQILIPRGLKSDLPLNFDKTDTLRFRYKYKTLPDSIFPRLMVNLFRYCSSGSYGRNAFVLEKESEIGENRALIEQGSDKSIRLWIGGDSPRSDFFAVIRDTFETIHQNFTQLEVKGFLPLDEKGKDEISFKAATNRLKENARELYCHYESGEKYDLVEKLGHYGQKVVNGTVININVAGDYFAGDFKGRDKIDNRNQTIIFNQQQLNDLTTFKNFLNEFLALTKDNQEYQQQINIEQRQQVNELTDRVDSMLATKTIPDKTKLQKLLARAKTIFGGIDKTVSLAEKAGKCILYVNKLIEWLD